jgi:hypothetical protein
VVTPTGTGSTRVEARDGDLTASVEVTVSLSARIVIEPGEIVLTPESPEAPVRASVLDGSGAPWKKSAGLTWTSSAPGVAAFADGRVRRTGMGEAVITAALGDIRGQLLVHAIDQRSALEQGCKAGGLDACVDLGKAIEDAGGGIEAEEKALALYEKACKAGALRGCVAAGEHKENGRSGTPDVAAALGAYRKACEGNHPPGCTRLGRLYETTVHDAGKALAAYRTACDAQDLEGCWRLGSVYELGKGVARDAAAAAELHKKACDGGQPQACTSLAHMRWNGSGAVTKDEQEAIALFEKACDAITTGAELLLPHPFYDAPDRHALAVMESVCLSQAAPHL